MNYKEESPRNRIMGIFKKKKLFTGKDTGW